LVSTDKRRRENAVGMDGFVLLNRSTQPTYGSSRERFTTLAFEQQRVSSSGNDIKRQRLTPYSPGARKTKRSVAVSGDERQRGETIVEIGSGVVHRTACDRAAALTSAPTG